VLAAHRAASLSDFRHGYFLYSEVIEADCRRHNIHDRIDRPYLVEVHFIDGYAVRLGFRLRKYLKDAQRQSPRALRHLQIPDDLPNLPHPGVVMVVIVPVVMVMLVFMMMVIVVMVLMIVFMMMIMLMIVVVLMAMRVGSGPALPVEVPVQVLHVVIMPVVLFIEDHIEVAAVYARFLHSADLRLESVSGNPLQDFQKLLLIRPKVKQRGYSHVAADSGPAFQIKDLITVLHPIYSLRRPGG
jgi:hypothetical protein